MGDKIADYYVVERGEDDLFYVKLKSSNGENLFTSEGYVDQGYADSVGKDTGLPSKEERVGI